MKNLLLLQPAVVPAIVLASLLTVLPSRAADAPAVQFPAPSPGSTLQQRVGLTDITITYSRPGAKDRKVFGGLVPFGELWRTGANAATKVSFTTDVKLNGAAVPAGEYALFTIPGEKEWTIIINRVANQSGSSNYDAQQDLARFKATPVALPHAVETFTIDVNDIRDESATLNLVWEKTRVPIKVEVDLTTKLVPQIEAAMAADGGNKPYYQAAQFYFDHNLDLQKARRWIDSAVAAQPRHFTTHLQAKILAKLGEKDAAIAAANRSIELAKQANDSSFVRLNEALLASLRR